MSLWCCFSSESFSCRLRMSQVARRLEGTPGCPRCFPERTAGKWRRGPVRGSVSSRSGDEVSPHRRFRTPKPLCLDRSIQSSCVMFSRFPVLLQVGEIGRQLATTITARTSERQTARPGRIWPPSFCSCPAYGQWKQNSSLAHGAYALPDSVPGAGRGRTGGYALHAR